MRDSFVASASRQRGQIIVVFALAAFAMIAMVGLVLDGGGTFVQRRIQQNAADLAPWLGRTRGSWIRIRPRATPPPSPPPAPSPHRAGTPMVWTARLSTWTRSPMATSPRRSRSTSAHHMAMPLARSSGCRRGASRRRRRAITGPGGSADGPAPVIFNVGVYNNGVQPKGSMPTQLIRSSSATATATTRTTRDIAWTDFAQPANVNSNVVRNLIDGSDVEPRAIRVRRLHRPGNQGNHSTEFGMMDQYKSDQNVVVAIVDDTGHFLGWGLFHVVSAQQGAKSSPGTSPRVSART